MADRKRQPWQRRPRGFGMEPATAAHEGGRRSRLGNYGLTPESFDAMLAAQGGRCAVCPATDPGGSNWNIDHDHTCCPGPRTCGCCVRGLLCTGCNTQRVGFVDRALKYGADPVRLAADFPEAMAYVARSRARAVG